MDQPEQQSAPLDLRELLRAALRFKWFIVSVAVAGAAVAALWTMRQPKVYEAVGIVEFDPRPSRPLGDDVQDVVDPVSSYWTLKEFYATQLRVLQSRTLAQRVVLELGLHHDPDFVGEESGAERKAAQQLLRRMDVRMINDTRLVEVSVEANDPERAAMLANAVIDAYIEKTLEDRTRASVSALEWLGEQLTSLRRELDESEMALHHFKEEHDVLSVSMEDRQNLVAREIEAFNAALTEARQARIRLAARADRLRQSLEVDPLGVAVPEGTEGASTAQLQEALRAKLADRAALGSRYGANHPQMKALTEEVQALREQLASTLQGIARGALADLREARQIETNLRAAVRDAHDAGLQLNLQEIEYLRLHRDRENKAKLYQVVLERNTETDLMRMSHQQAVRVVDPAIPPETASRPNVPMNTAFGVLLGLALGLGVAFAGSLMDRRLKGPKDVEEFGIAILGILPRIDRDSGEGFEDLVAYRQPMSQAAECCRTIRTNLTFMSPDDPITSFVVTSATPREGKTTVAANVAISMANAGQRVLLIDTDLRRPRVHKAFHLGNEQGVTSVAMGAVGLSSGVQSTMVDGLDVLTSGPVPPNPSELLHGRGFAALVRDALTKYDKVILDSPPLGAVTDAAILSTIVQGVLIVTKTEKTTRDGLKHVIRQLEAVSARILGAVVNNVDAARSSEGYYQYYRYRYTDDLPETQQDAAE